MNGAGQRAPFNCLAIHRLTPAIDDLDCIINGIFHGASRRICVDVIFLLPPTREARFQKMVYDDHHEQENHPSEIAEP